MIAFIAFLLFPLEALAATVQSVFLTLTDIVNIVSPVLMSVAVAVFLYGVVKYIIAAGDADKEKTARGYIIYGIIGLFVMVAFWGLVTVLSDTFNLGGESSSITLPALPTLPGGGGGGEGSGSDYVPPPSDDDGSDYVPPPADNGDGSDGDGGDDAPPPPPPPPVF